LTSCCPGDSCSLSVSFYSLGKQFYYPIASVFDFANLFSYTLELLGIHIKNIMATETLFLGDQLEQALY
jgi:hypothetical protein